MSHIYLEDGKYTVVRDGGNMHALRNGETWRDLTGDKLVGALCARIDELTAPDPLPKKPPVRLTMWDVKTPEEMQSAIQTLKNEAVNRYTVDHGSNSGHCCFDSSVIDTRSERRRAVCECFERDDAEKIAALLNGSVPVLQVPAQPRHIAGSPWQGGCIDELRVPDLTDVVDALEMCPECFKMHVPDRVCGTCRRLDK